MVAKICETETLARFKACLSHRADWWTWACQGLAALKSGHGWPVTDARWQLVVTRYSGYGNVVGCIQVGHPARNKRLEIG